jgi:hypothetical protein
MKLFKRRIKEQIIPEVDLRNFRFLGEEAEALGKRLDAARKSQAESTTLWAVNHWTKTVEQLVAQWRRLPILHDADAKMSVIPRWTVDYDFYELSEEPTGKMLDVFDKLYHYSYSKDPDLSWSWENNRAARLARAQ